MPSLYKLLAIPRWKWPYQAVVCGTLLLASFSIVVVFADEYA